MLLADALWLGLSLADWAVIALYFVVIVGIGLWSIRKVHDMSDFFMGGRRFGPVSMMFFAFGAGTSSEQAISVVAGTYRVGLAGIWWQFLWLWATPFYWIIAPVMRRMRALTTADFFEARFGGGTGTLYSLCGISMSIVFIAGGLYASGQMITALTGGELDRLARRIDWRVPEMNWDAERNWFGRSVLFTEPLDDAAADDLDAGRLPVAVRERLTDRKGLSEDLRVEVIEPGRRWRLLDEGHRVDYPLHTITVADSASAGGEAAATTVERLRVENSGWRRVEGHEFAILAMTVLFVLYGMAGGLGAAIITDLIQGVLTIIFSFLLLPFAFRMIGGFGALHAADPPRRGMSDLFVSSETAQAIAGQLGKEPITLFYVVMLSLTGLAGIVVQPHIMGVCGAGKTEFEGRFGFTFGNFLKRFCTIAWTFTGLACIVWYLGADSPLRHNDAPATGSAAFTELSEAEQARIAGDRERYDALTLTTRAREEEFEALPPERKSQVRATENNFADRLFGRAAREILPTIAPGLIGLLLASLLAAVMSTSDAQMVVSSGLFTENIYRKHLARGRSQRHYLWIGRIAGLLIVTVALVLQATFSDVIHALQIIIDVPAAIGISLWMGIIWRGWTPAAVWVSTVCMVLMWVAGAYFADELLALGLPEFMFRKPPDSQSWQMTAAWHRVLYLGAGIVPGLLTSFVTPRVREERLDYFFRLLHTPVRAGEEVTAPCTLPENPLPPREKLFKSKDIEIPKPTVADIVGFVGAWICAGLLVWLTARLAAWL